MKLIRIIVSGVVLIAVIGAIAGHKSSTTLPAAVTTPSSSASVAPTPAASDTSGLTESQKNAVEAAKEYLNTQAFSRSGLIKQLSSSYGSGFPLADATFAVDSLNVNWNYEAAQAAKEYLSTQAFSRAGLIQQLDSSYGSGFTYAQAVYGVTQAGL